MQVFLHIQVIINNIFFSTIKKTPNEITYNFAPKQLLDFFSLIAISNALAP